jgi:hypothetical protein
MGHALLIVVVEPNTPLDEIEFRVQELMDPYDEDSKTAVRESFEEACLCTEERDEGADPECEECGGTGVVTATYNPQQMFDWYEVGGRWDGVIQREAAVDAPWGDSVSNNVGRNMVRVRDIGSSFIPWAVLTPDGTWHGGGGTAEKDEAAWAIELGRILGDYPDHLAISIDFHYLRLT